ncbi:polysaccharide biosynthesis tyrosine autokinase [Rhodococcoides kroppenstedtii]|uniref:polysaccharide biosynthesis tyrosine autokinase n=1 Tax=Rhodococcoides kroppenstedtii TaxID=293050 RepID=UPI001BDE3A8F|nr:polysaccharide biosynthesis tyrosine autokinase [Rhodococcus kroppenstedtii]MBT1191861.1 polysaccharide biosynthesis tyrosine autokinase [Rhodococcus kroppenstedtii]
MGIGEYLSALRTQWVIVVACAVLSVVAAAGVSALTQPSYVASTRLFVNTTAGETASDAYQGSLFSAGRVASYAELASGEEVARRVVDSLGLQESAEQVMSRVAAGAVPGSVLLDVTASAGTAEAARDLANSVAEQTSDLVRELESAGREGNPAVFATIADFADMPAQPTSPLWARNLAFGLLAGLIVGSIAAVARTLGRPMMHRAADLATVAGPVLGTIASVRRASPNELLAVDRHAAALETFRELRASFLAAATATGHRTILIAGPSPGTGASTVAAGLAASLAEASRSVVLIDADLRGPSVHRTFETGATAGLAEYLADTAAMDDVVMPTDIDNLSIFAAGTEAPGTRAAFGTPRMAETVELLRQYFEYVIVDAPAVSTGSDTTVLAACVDAAVLVARVGVTARRDVTTAAEKVRSSGTPVMGSVANAGPRGRRAGHQ